MSSKKDQCKLIKQQRKIEWGKNTDGSLKDLRGEKQDLSFMLLKCLKERRKYGASKLFEE